MLNFSNSHILHIISHMVGNVTLDEELVLSKAPIMKVSEDTDTFLTQLMLNPFSKNSHILHHFRHSSSLDLNDMYAFCTAMFNERTASDTFSFQDMFVKLSQNMARKLYDVSTHPKIPGNELIVAYVQEVVFQDEVVDCIAIVKLGRPENFVQLEHLETTTQVEHFRGIGLDNVQKGVLVFNTHKEEGYILALLDNEKEKDGGYWSSDFLGTKQVHNSFFHTDAYMHLCNDFVTNVLPEKFDVTTIDQFDIKKRTLDFFKEKEKFDFNEFKQEVLQQPEVIDLFREHKQATAENVADEFDISDKATKQQEKNYKRIIKLDKNFHIHFHGNKELIEKGKDEVTGMSYYKLYFNEER